jgi:hypothetical protein
MVRNILSTITLLIFTISGNAQTTTSVVEVLDTTKSAVTIEQDNRIDLMADKKILIKVASTTKQATSTKNVKQDVHGRVNMYGYRVQVYSGTDRAMAYTIKAQLYQRFPDQRPYVMSQVPFFKVRMGNFVDKKEADRYKKIVAPSYAGSIVVGDTIEMKVKPKAKEVAEVKEEKKK